MIRPNIESVRNPMTGRVRPRKRVYTVWVVFNKIAEWKMYWCPDCREPIAQYMGDSVAEAPGEAIFTMPVMIQCRNPDCGRKILFQQSVTRVDFGV